MPVELKKISVNLPIDLLNYIQGFADRESTTVTDALRRAISTLQFVEQTQEEGKLLLTRDPVTKETERIVFR